MKRAVRLLKQEQLNGGYQRAGYRRHEGQALENALSSPVHEIHGVVFEASTADQIRKEALTSVRSSQMYRRGRVPARFGLLDMRMGSRDPRFKCATCGEPSSLCNGHMGCLDLAMPVYNPHYLKHVQAILQSICAVCMRPRVNAPPQKGEPVKCKGDGGGVCERASRFKDQTRCAYPSCGALHPTYKRCSNTYIRRIWSVRAKNALRKSMAKTDPVRFKALTQPLRAVEVHDTLCVMESLGMAQRLRDIAGEGPGTVQPFTRLLFDSLPVSPVSLRPTIMLSVGSKLRSESEQTIVYQAIVKENAKLVRMMLSRARNSAMGSSRPAAPMHNFMDQPKFREVYDSLQAVVSMFISASARAHNPNISRRRRSGETRRSLSSYLTGKTGLLRSNVQGKRGNNGARTVVTGDPHIPVDVVTVPQFIATRLHRAERVTRFNLAKMRERVIRGAGRVNGAHKVLLPPVKGKQMRHRALSYALWRADREKIAAALAPGYTVVRYLETGDRVLFNRQPSLSRKSMMVFRVMVIEDEPARRDPSASRRQRQPKGMPRTVFGMHLSVTSAFNADFDGDEMNIHLLNSYEAEAEGQYLASVPRQVTNELNSKTTLSIVQDSVLGAYLLSRSDQWFTKDQYMQLVSQSVASGDQAWTVPAPDRPGGGRMADGSAAPPMWSGKQVLSAFMPPISVRAEDFQMSHGRITSGNVTKKVLNGGSKSILYKTAHYCGDDRAVRLAEDLQRVTRVFLSWRGGEVAIGADNLMAHTQNEKENQRARASAVREACAWGQRIIYIGLRERMSLQYLEADAQAHFGSMLRLDGVARGGSPAATNDALSTVVKSGSKGSWINLSQMRTCVGQQSQNGSRLGVLAADAPDDPRLSAHEPPPSDILGGLGACDLIDMLEPWSETAEAALRAPPRARGFVKSSFREGLGMAEFFYHSMSGRVGVIDTSCKTAESGYLQRKLCKALEDLVLAYDYTVRDVSNGGVVSFLYGEGDGFDPKRLCVVGAIPGGTDDRTAQQTRKCKCSACKRKNALRSEWKDIRDRTGHPTPETSRKFGLPFEPACLWLQVRSGPESIGDADRQASKKFLERCAADLLDFLESAGEGTSGGVLGDVAAGGSLRSGSLSTHLPLRISVAHHMCTQRVLPETESRILEFVGRARHHFYRALACAGDSVGASAATSLGASLTQSTLNTFHFAGVAEKRSMTLGIPRYKELVNASANISNSYVDVHLINDADDNRSARAASGMTRALWPQAPLLSGDGSNDAGDEGGGSDDQLPLWDQTSVVREQRRAAKRSRREMTSARYKFVGKLHAAAPPSAEVCRRIRSGAPWGEDGSDLPALRLSHRGRTLTAQLVHPNHAKLTAKEREAAARFLGEAFESLARQPSAAPAPTQLGAKMAWAQKDGSVRVLMSGSGSGKHSHRGGGSSAIIYAMQRLWTTFRRRGVPFDFKRTYSNDVFAVCACLGVEAARTVVEQEFSTVLCGDGTYISRRHVVLAADFMTSRGTFTGMTRHDYKRNFKHRGALARACFEQPVEVLVDAASSGETDPVQTASARVMTGRRVQNGTGSFAILTNSEYAEVAANYGKSAVPPTPFFSAPKSRRQRTIPIEGDPAGDKKKAPQQVVQESTQMIRSSPIDTWSARNQIERKKKAQPSRPAELSDIHPERRRLIEMKSSDSPARAENTTPSDDPHVQRVMREHSGLYAYENLMRAAHTSFARSRAQPNKKQKTGYPGAHSWLQDEVSEGEEFKTRLELFDDQDSAAFLPDSSCTGEPSPAASTTTATLTRHTDEPLAWDSIDGKVCASNDAFGLDSALACAYRASNATLHY